jgi:hypothetical protein
MMVKFTALACKSTVMGALERGAGIKFKPSVICRPGCSENLFFAGKPKALYGVNMALSRV